VEFQRVNQFEHVGAAYTARPGRYMVLSRAIAWRAGFATVVGYIVRTDRGICRLMFA
jgi:hypothetical protein